MTTLPEQDKSASDPRTAGFVTRLMSKALGRMTPAERNDLMQDAAAFSADELGKASQELGKGDNAAMTVDSRHTGFIEDHWSTGKEQDVAPVSSTYGPDSSTVGTIPVGPSQQASGNAGPRMEAQYSRHAPQTGLQTATERLGRDITGIKGAMKSVIEAMKGVNTQLEALKAGTASSDTTVVQTLIDAAVAKALEPIKADLHKVVVKAFEKKEKKDDDKEDDEDAKSAALQAKANEIDKARERDEESDEKSASSLAAAELRVMAKARVQHARLRMSKALDYAAEDKSKAAQRAMSFAQINIAKAETLLDESTALQDGKVGLSTQSIALDIAKAKKGLAASTAANQDIWPATSEAPVGKADEPEAKPVAAEAAKAPATATPPNADLAKAVAQIEAAATGMGMMTASVADLFKALSNQTKPVEATTVTGERVNMPPVFALAKASGPELATREAELAKLRDSHEISFMDHDRARDALTRVRMGLPDETIKAMVDRLPEAARAVLTRSAA